MADREPDEAYEYATAPPPPGTAAAPARAVDDDDDDDAKVTEVRAAEADTKRLEEEMERIKLKIEESKKREGRAKAALHGDDYGQDEGSAQRLVAALSEKDKARALAARIVL